MSTPKPTWVQLQVTPESLAQAQREQASITEVYARATAEEEHARTAYREANDTATKLEIAANTARKEAQRLYNAYIERQGRALQIRRKLREADDAVHARTDALAAQAAYKAEHPEEKQS